MSAGDKRERHLSEDEDALWSGVARSIKPLRASAVKRNAEHAAPATPSKPKAPTKTAAKMPSGSVDRVPTPKPKLQVPALATLDRRTKQKLARGREAIDARIDLHGLTQAEAYNALLHFLHRVQADGAKFIIVVTGKGARSSPGERGVLRRQVPEWLRLPEFRTLVVGFESAHVGHGGDGALYVRVRRRR
jgi:DNA-nicking Smr family endonuclease